MCGNICYNRKLLPISKSQPSLKLAILLLLAGDVSLNPGPSTCSTDRVRLATLNARSMKNKAASLADMVSSKKIDILAITETWLKPSDTFSCLSDLTPPEFSLLHKPGTHGRGGGVGFLISNEFKVTDYTIPSFSTFECICLKVSGSSFEGLVLCMYQVSGSSFEGLVLCMYQVSGSSFEGLVLCMYHPEPSHSDTFYQEFQELLELLIPLATEFYILGDSNLHLDKKQSPTTTKFAIFLNLLISSKM